MIRPLVIWGYILLIGFSINYYFAAFDYESYYYYTLWVVLVIIGIVGTIMDRSRFSKIADKRVTVTWISSVILGLILTVLISSGILAISPYDIMTIWLILIGFAIIIQSKIVDKQSTSLIGLSWIVIAMIIFVTCIMDPIVFMIGGAIIGATMISWGAAS